MAQTAATATREELQSIMIEVARAEFAAVRAALKFWGGWVESADKYTQKLSAELDKVSNGGELSQKFVGNLTDLTREYLREVISLPNTALEHFNGELEKISKPSASKPAAPRARRARAKE